MNTLVARLSSLFAAATMALAAATGCSSAVVDEQGSAAASASVTVGAFYEGFEAATKTSYALGDVAIGTGTWTMNDALVGSLATDVKSGTKSVRIRNTGAVRMAFDKPGGAETVTIGHARYGTDGASTWELWYSSDAGQTWARAGEPVTTAGSTLETATFTVHVDGPVRLEIRKTGGGANRIDIDDVVVSDFTPDKLRLASWNGRQLSVASRDATERAQIAAVLDRFDAVAVQEVGDTTILGELRNALEARGGRWESVTSPLLGNTGSTAERYGVLYRSNKLHVAWTQALPEMITETGVAFDREPFVFEMATNDGRFDFAFVDVHVTWGSVVANRVAEIKKLRDYYGLVVPNEKDVLLVGDFNRNANDASVTWLQQNAGILSTTSPTAPTSVTGTSTYDEILLNPATTTEYTGTHGVLAFDQELFAGDTAAASLAVSDHRPVWIEVQPAQSDDD